MNAEKHFGTGDLYKILNIDRDSSMAEGLSLIFIDYFIWFCFNFIFILIAHEFSLILFSEKKLL